jgi:FG-GAP-like repeat
MRQVAPAALVVLVLGGCGGDGGSSSSSGDPGPFIPFGEPSPTGRFFPQHLAVAWIDGDAYPDVALTDGVHPEVRVLLGAGDGSFMLIAPHSFGIPNDPIAIAAGFFNLDTFVDLVVIPATGEHQLLLGNGDGTFVPLYTMPPQIIPNVPASVLVAANFDGDFFDDFAFGSPDGRMGVVLGTATGMFSSLGVNNLPTLSPARSQAVGDMDFDGDLDVVTLQNDSTLTVHIQQGGSFNFGVASMIGGDPRAVVVGRFDLSPGDDIAVIDGAGAQVRFFSAPTFPFPPPFDTVALGESGFAIALEPRPLSTRDAVVVTTINPTLGEGMLLRIAFDEASGTFLAAPIADAPVFPVSLAFADMNLDSAPDLLVGSFDVQGPTQGFLQTFIGTGQ